MAEENDKLLTEDELAAIEEMVATGDLGGEGYNVGVATGNYDLTRQDTSVGVNVTAIEQINDRLHRFMRIGLLEELRYNARLQPGRTEIIRYEDYVASTAPPLAVNVTKIDPLRGECLIVIHSQVVFSCLDNWFGGSPKSLTSVPAGRIFTPTENAVINKIRGVIFNSLAEAWAPFMQVECSLSSSEISAVFANIAADDEMVIMNRFETQGDGEDLGFVDVVYPYANLKQVREVLSTRITTSGSDAESDARWSADLLGSIEEVPIEGVVKAVELSISVDELSNMKVGDWFPIRPPEHAELSVNGFPVFNVEVGSRGNQVAIQIVESVMSEDEG
jgi:flagellar motor switch protein FliM